MINTEQLPRARLQAFGWLDTSFVFGSPLGVSARIPTVSTYLARPGGKKKVADGKCLPAGSVEVVCLEESHLNHQQVLRAQFLCHRSKFAAPLLGFLGLEMFGLGCLDQKLLVPVSLHVIQENMF